MDDGKELFCDRRLFWFPVRKPGQNQKLPGCNAGKWIRLFNKQQHFLLVAHNKKKPVFGFNNRLKRQEKAIDPTHFRLLKWRRLQFFPHHSASSSTSSDNNQYDFIYGNFTNEIAVVIEFFFLFSWIFTMSMGCEWWV